MKKVALIALPALAVAFAIFTVFNYQAWQAQHYAGDTLFLGADSLTGTAIHILSPEDTERLTDMTPVATAFMKLSPGLVIYGMDNKAAPANIHIEMSGFFLGRRLLPEGGVKAYFQGGYLTVRGRFMDETLPLCQVEDVGNPKSSADLVPPFVLVLPQDASCGGKSDAWASAFRNKLRKEDQLILTLYSGDHMPVVTATVGNIQAKIKRRAVENPYAPFRLYLKFKGL
ncbi:hypothetical protein [Asticcacaulis sp. YBE204]|uniref:hypothetical protein n=1 Tax=Asticcacaulis sp. YBE204 TaxID=1282363 RepID=UPI0003C3F3CE|nr:hypothetical protein [Asticcacaulis sp. YBE204]ESQ78549.1 hypothetical protein AEYBE204_13445 [Asticcacaulis sp. YBE204]